MMHGIAGGSQCRQAVADFPQRRPWPPCAGVLGARGDPAHANPATVDYRCRPALTGGGTLSIDYNSGGKSITAQFPDGKSIRMSGRAKRFYIYYAGEHAKVWGIRQKTINLAVMGQPTRRCVATSL